MRPDVAESAVWEVEFDFDDDNKPAELDVELLFDIPKEHLIEAFDFDVAAAAASNAAAESFCDAPAGLCAVPLDIPDDAFDPPDRLCAVRSVAIGVPAAEDELPTAAEDFDAAPSSSPAAPPPVKAEPPIVVCGVLTPEEPPRSERYVETDDRGRIAPAAGSRDAAEGVTYAQYASRPPAPSAAPREWFGEAGDDDEMLRYYASGATTKPKRDKSARASDGDADDDDAATTARDELARGFRKGVKAMRANAAPGCALWSLAVAVAVAFERHARFRAAVTRLGELKRAWSFGFTFVVIGFMGGLLPSALLALRAPRAEARRAEARRAAAAAAADTPVARLATRPPATPRSLVAYNALFFAAYGCWIDLFYLGQGAVLGDGGAAATVAAKAAVDQLVATPFLHVPGVQLALLFGRDCACSPARFRAVLAHRRMLSRRALLGEWWFPALLPTWLVWAPTVCVVYALPAPVQIIMFALVLTFWSLVQMVLGVGGDDAEDGGARVRERERARAAPAGEERKEELRGPAAAAEAGSPTADELAAERERFERAAAAAAARDRRNAARKEPESIFMNAETAFTDTFELCGTSPNVPHQKIWM